MRSSFEWRRAVIRASGGPVPAALVNLGLADQPAVEDVVAAVAGIPGASQITCELVRPSPGINPDRVRLVVDVPIVSLMGGRFTEDLRAVAVSHAPRQTIDLGRLREAEESLGQGGESLRGPRFALSDLANLLDPMHGFDVVETLLQLEDLLGDGGTQALTPAGRFRANTLAALICTAALDGDFVWPTEALDKPEAWAIAGQGVLGYRWTWDQACIVAGRVSLAPQTAPEDLWRWLAVVDEAPPAGETREPEAASEPAGAPEGSEDEAGTGAPGASGEPSPDGDWMPAPHTGVDLAQGADATVTVERLAGDADEQPADGAVPSGETQDPPANA